jgi:hypothetical protein
VHRQLVHRRLGLPQQLIGFLETFGGYLNI